MGRWSDGSGLPQWGSVRAGGMSILKVMDASLPWRSHDFRHFNFYYAVKMVPSQATNRVRSPSGGCTVNLRDRGSVFMLKPHTFGTENESLTLFFWGKNPSSAFLRFLLRLTCLGPLTMPSHSVSCFYGDGSEPHLESSSSSRWEAASGSAAGPHSSVWSSGVGDLRGCAHTRVLSPHAWYPAQLPPSVGGCERQLTGGSPQEVLPLPVSVP